ncbi:hypothetical protein B0T24DRAFT_339316 [Lasiosphaeria ovina]|uniref:Uncharacterized protein n=1 Tax=Lasiosphaeria ovina TaxID=92902 RepID=A0AAE0N720_9PEZI|nr:hypothetical protein B0T24DRAFT_339316 [Lasiosphaeria ovina]
MMSRNQDGRRDGLPIFDSRHDDNDDGRNNLISYNGYKVNNGTTAIRDWLYEIPSQAGGGESQASVISAFKPPENPSNLKPLEQKQQQQKQTIAKDEPPSQPQPLAQMLESPGHSPGYSSNGVFPHNTRANKDSDGDGDGDGDGIANLAALRQTIIANFRRRCIDPGRYSTILKVDAEIRHKSADRCLQCITAQEYTMKPHHSKHFLSLYLLPISEGLSYPEMTTHLNASIVSRLSQYANNTKQPSAAATSSAGLFANGPSTAAAGAARPKTYPVIQDFVSVRLAAQRRRDVFDAFPLHVDRFGMLRDDVYRQARTEPAAAAAAAAPVSPTQAAPPPPETGARIAARGGGIGDSIGDSKPKLRSVGKAATAPAAAAAAAAAGFVVVANRGRTEKEVPLWETKTGAESEASLPRYY